MKFILVSAFFLTSVYAQWVQDKFIIGSYGQPLNSYSEGNGMCGNNFGNDITAFQDITNVGINTLLTTPSPTATHSRHEIYYTMQVAAELKGNLRIIATEYAAPTPNSGATYGGCPNNSGTYLSPYKSFFKQGANNFSSTNAAEISSFYKFQLTSPLRNIFIGYYNDEPSKNGNPDDVNNNNNWINEFAKPSNDPTKLFYTCLLPYNPPLTSNIFANKTEYESYFNSYANNNSSPVLSFDHYPFYYDPSTYDPKKSNNTILQSKNYFYNQGLFSEKCKATGKVYWGVALSTSHETWDASHLNMGIKYSALNEPDLKFMAFSPVIYGAKGIIWYTYRSFLNGGETDDINSGFVKNDNSRSSNYDVLKKINLYLQDIGPFLMNLNWITTFHGATTDPVSGELNLSTLASNQLAQQVISNISTSSVNGLPFIEVGILKTKTTKDNYIVILNKDRTTPTSITTISIYGKLYPRIFSKSTRAWSLFPSTYNSNTNVTTFSVSQILAGDMELIWLDSLNYMVPIRSLLLQ